MHFCRFETELEFLLASMVLGTLELWNCVNIFLSTLPKILVCMISLSATFGLPGILICSPVCGVLVCLISCKQEMRSISPTWCLTVAVKLSVSRLFGENSCTAYLRKHVVSAVATLLSGFVCRGSFAPPRQTVATATFSPLCQYSVMHCKH